MKGEVIFLNVLSIYFMELIPTKDKHQLKDQGTKDMESLG